MAREMRARLWVCLLAASFIASTAGAVEFFVPVPHLGGQLRCNTEFVRENLAKVNVDFTYVPEGQAGVNRTPLRHRVLPGPSTDQHHPLLTDNYNRDYVRPPGRSEPKYFLPGGGLVRMEGEQGLVGAETAVLIGGEPTAGWELPMLTRNDAFAAGSTVYVLNLMRGGNTASHLSLFNIDGTAAQCRARLRAPDGRILDDRQGLVVPAFGAVRLPDFVSRTVTVTAATGLSAVVSCNRPFYALGSFPATDPENIRVHYPSPSPPTLGTREILLNSPAGFRVTQTTPEIRFTLPLLENTRYRSVILDFDVAVRNPTNGAYFRSLVGMWRPEPGRRFKKKLFFGTVERFDRSKLMVDLGTPFIEVLVKRGKAALVGGRTYHFHIEVDADQKTLRQLVTTVNGTVVSDLITGLFNDDLRAIEDRSLIVGFGLPGIADDAYSPPFGWRFTNVIISGYR
jgi:hypothetical protein